MIFNKTKIRPIISKGRALDLIQGPLVRSSGEAKFLHDSLTRVLCLIFISRGKSEKGLSASLLIYT